MSDYIPKVGEVCQIKNSGAKFWYTAEICYISHQRIVFVIDDVEDSVRCDSVIFRPIKSARDKAIDEMYNIAYVSSLMSYGSGIEKLYDAGYRKVKPISLDEFRSIGPIISAQSYYDGLVYGELVKLGHIVSE